MKYKCYLIDDVRDALDVLAMHISNTPDLELTGMETDASLALQYLVSGSIQADFVFVDIDMPGISGVEIARQLKGICVVIFVTAHRHYAPEAFETGVAYYLLKPVFEDAFREAVAAARSRWAMLNHYTQDNADPYFTVPGDGKYEKLRLERNAVLYIQARANYSDIYLADSTKRITTYMGLNMLEELLPMPDFVRVHRSFMVNTKRIVKYKADCVYMGPHIKIPISSKYKTQFQKLMLYKDQGRQ